MSFLLNLTSVLRLDGDDALPLWTEALRGPSLNFELIGNVLRQVWDGQTGLSTVSVHLEGAHVAWKNNRHKLQEVKCSLTVYNYKV